MDRRTLIAIVLATLVLIVYQAFLAPKPPVRTPPAPSASTADTLAGSASNGPKSGAPGAASLGVSTGGGSIGGPRAFHNSLLGSQPPAGSADFGNSKYSVTIDPVGARVSKWSLASFTDARENPADLVADRSLGLFQFRLSSPRGPIDFSHTPFVLTRAETPNGQTATLEAKDSTGASIRINYAFPKDSYAANVEVTVEGIPNDKKDVNLSVVFPAGVSFLERDPRPDKLGAAAVALIGDTYTKHGLGRGSGAWTEREDGVVRWVGVRSKYFLAAALPEAGTDGDVEMSRAGGTETISAALTLSLNITGPTTFRFRMYGGPLDFRQLATYGVDLEKTVDLGWKFLIPFSRLLLRFFLAVHTVVPNYGLVILVLSVVTRGLFYPLTKKSMESMKQMQLLKPEIDRLNEKFKDDPQRKNQATLELYRKHKVNPLGGCLPILIQMPVFVALYNVLNSSIELRKAHFVAWITDLSAPDRVGAIAGFPIHILPLVMAGTMLWQQKLTPTDPRQASMAYIMPLVMTVFFYQMPSGLVFYWTVSNLMSVTQQIWMNRSMQQPLVAA